MRFHTYGPVRTLPTRVFFYGMQPAEKISVETDPGKTLEIRPQTLGETTEEGDVRVFFELNGQHRMIRVPNRAAKARPRCGPRCRKGMRWMCARRCRRRLLL